LSEGDLLAGDRTFLWWGHIPLETLQHIFTFGFFRWTLRRGSQKPGFCDNTWLQSAKTAKNPVSLVVPGPSNRVFATILGYSRQKPQKTCWLSEVETRFLWLWCVNPVWKISRKFTTTPWHPILKLLQSRGTAKIDTRIQKQKVSVKSSQRYDVQISGKRPKAPLI